MKAIWSIALRTLLLSICNCLGTLYQVNLADIKGMNRELGRLTVKESDVLYNQNDVEKNVQVCF